MSSSLAGMMSSYLTGDFRSACVPSLMPRTLPARVNRHVAIVSDPEDPDSTGATYLYYLAWPLKSNFASSWAGNGRHQKCATKRIIESDLWCALPPLPEQRAIAHVLGTLDDKIELNRRMNETLEEMARALFKSWFVDFEPVRAKMDGRWRRGESLPGLPAEHYDLFPDRLVPSELGEVPEGWAVKPLDSIADFLNGLALQKYPAGDGSKLPVIKIAQLRVGHTSGADVASADIPSSYVVHNGDVLFSWSGSLELAVWAGGDGALNQHLFKVTSKSYPKWLFYNWIREHLPWFRAIAADKATTMGHIRRQHLGEALVVVPQPTILEAMDTQMRPLLDMSLYMRTESRALAVQRDALLPGLMSGEVGVDPPVATDD